MWQRELSWTSLTVHPTLNMTKLRDKKHFFPFTSVNVNSKIFWVPWQKQDNRAEVLEESLDLSKTICISTTLIRSVAGLNSRHAHHKYQGSSSWDTSCLGTS